MAITFGKVAASLGAVGGAFGAVAGIGYGAWNTLDYIELRPVLIRELHAQDAQLTRSIGEVRDNTQKALDQVVQSVNTVSRTVNLGTYTLLVKKYEDHTITAEEQVLLCAIAADLNIDAPGCR